MSYYPHNEPIVSNELMVYRQLNARMKLPAYEKQYYTNLEKGYEGQVKFFHLLKDNLSIEFINLNDLLLKQNNTEFQLDVTLLTQHKIYLFEVKNFEGDYIIKNETWTTLAGVEITNPLLQLQRSESLLRRLLHKSGYKLQIEAYVVFVNPEFTLYNATPTLPIILPTQLNRLLKTLSKSESSLNQSHSNLAKRLVSLHLPKSSNSRLPEYRYDQVGKGFVCCKCYGGMEGYNQRALICKVCGCVENINSAILRSTREFNLLFPELKITTTNILQWCNIIENKARINRVLLGNLELIPKGKYSYYIFPTDKR